jgi:hypothetical protein
MGYPTRIYYSESDRQKIFDRWLAGESRDDHCALSPPLWAEHHRQSVVRWQVSWPASYSWSGHRIRSRVGSSAHTRTM